MFLANYSSDAGGGHTFQEEVFESFLEVADESRHSFVVFCNPEWAAKYSTEVGKNVSLRTLKTPGLVERTISALRKKVLAVLRKRWNRPSAIELAAREAGVEFIWFVSTGVQVVNYPYLTVVWDLQHRLHPWFPEVSANGEWDSREALYSRFLRRAAKVIVGTRAGQREIERFYQVPAERIKIIPHPTPKFALHAHEASSDQVIRKYGVPEGYLFYPAQFWAHKNHANLLLAVRILRDKFGLTLPVVFVGSDKGNLQYVREFAKNLDMDSQIFFLGFVPKEDLIGLYRKALALVYVTFFGPENLPPLEAFALGCPVIASDVAGAREQLGDAALFVSPESPEQIALAIMALKDDAAQAQTLIRKGYERAGNWTGHNFVRGVFSILDEFEPVRRCWAK